jgi:hypothetical protein
MAEWDVSPTAGQLHFSNTVRVADDDLEIFDLNNEAQSEFVRAFSIFCKALSFFASSSFQFTSFNISAVPFSLFHLFS